MCSSAADGSRRSGPRRTNGSGCRKATASERRLNTQPHGRRRCTPGWPERSKRVRPVPPNRTPRSSANLRLYVVPRGVAVDSLPDGVLPAGIVSAQEHCLTSDVTRARVTGATALPADRLAADRAEGRLLACVHSEGAWFGISKVPLTLCTSQGKDALMTDVPSGVIDVLRLVCPELLVVIHENFFCDNSGRNKKNSARSALAPPAALHRVRYEPVTRERLRKNPTNALSRPTSPEFEITLIT